MGVPGFDSVELGIHSRQRRMTSLNRTKNIDANNVIYADFGKRTALAA